MAGYRDSGKTAAASRWAQGWGGGKRRSASGAVDPLGLLLGEGDGARDLFG
jgi:hypothetical protein